MLNRRIFKFYDHPCYVTLLHNMVPNCQQVRQKRTHEMNNGQIKLLMEVFDLPYRQTYKIVSKHEVLRTLNQNHIRKVADVLNRFGIDKGDIANHPEVLSDFPTAIENHAMLLEEGGFCHVTAQELISYVILVRKPIRLLKAYKYIPSDIDVHKSFLSSLSDPPPQFDSLSSNNDWNNRSFMDVKLAALRHYLQWRLEMEPGELDSVIKTYFRIKHRSFRLIEKSLKILEEEIGFSKKKIRRHGYLIHSHPGNTMDNLSHIKTLGGMDIKAVFLKYPKVLVSSTDTLIKTAQHLHDFGIPDAAIQKHPEVFTLGSETVFRRLAALQSVPEFIGLVKNPGVLRLVHCQRKAYSRLNYLQELKVRCASLHLLSSPQAYFERYLREGSDRTRGDDITKFLSLEFDATEVRIRKLLQRHPYWCSVPLSTVRDTLCFLLNKGFTRDQVLFSIHALLYSRSQLEKELDALSSRHELSFGFPTYQQTYTAEVQPQKKLCHLLPQHRLALCVYFIERNFHFTGDGIWADIVVSAGTSVPDI